MRLFQRLIALPYARLELPGWGRMLRAAGISGASHVDWSKAGEQVVRGKKHKYLIRLNLANGHERTMYFLGRSEELEVELFLERCLRLGESLVDVGANLGMLTLFGARLVGSAGRVFAFEPNPVEADRIRSTIELNGIRNVVLQAIALGSRRGEMTLHVNPNLTALGTLAPVTGEDVMRYKVQVHPGDDVLPSDMRTRTIVKIDVEGFEVEVLRGMTNFLRSNLPAVITEVEPDWLKRAGSSVGDLFSLMCGAGYQAYHLGLGRAGLGWRFLLTAVRNPEQLSRVRAIGSCRNVLWIAPNSEFEDRIWTCTRAAPE